MLTLGHSNHVGGLKKILQKQKLPVFSHWLDIKHMEGVEPFSERKKKGVWVEPGIVQPLQQKEDGILQAVGDLAPCYTPGHSPGHVSYYHRKDQVLISGDLCTSGKGKLKQPMKIFAADMKQAGESGKIVNELKPVVVSICHGKDIQHPHTQLEVDLNSY